ncbi:MAG: Gfo/Idh/MocA family oxidoreductase [Phycisphaerae bacterium]|nr:Gfo/Idh/MocA family oxidoreductase [Phycisphaerae bacterium]
MIRFGIIGAGRMAGYTLFDLMKDHPVAKPVAWFEPDTGRPDTVERLPRFRDIGLTPCGSLDELLRRDDLDIILNLTPHYAHAETTIAALHAGHHVLCEKPPACSWSECQAMIDARDATGKKLLIHFQHLLRPSARWLNRKLVAGELGRIRRVRCISLWWRDAEYYRRVPWGGKRAFQGRPTLDGTMVNQSVHFLNQTLNLAQRSGESHVAMPAEMHAKLYRFHEPEDLEVEDTVVATGVLDNDDATEFVFAATTCAAEAAATDRAREYRGLPEQHCVTLECEHGTARWDGTARIDRPGQPTETCDDGDGPWPFYFHLQRVLRDEEPAVTPVEQSSRTMRFIFAAYAAASETVIQAPWADAPQVAATLRRCEQNACLPHQLDNPPAWA